MRTIYSTIMFNAQQNGGEFDIWSSDNEGIYEYDYKSPKRAFIYSLIVPGWGQKYAKSHAIKILAFLAIEAGSWMEYFKYHNDGNQKTDEFEAFADEHWIEGRVLSETSVDPAQSYRGWLLTEYGVVDDDDIGEFTHHLPETKDQQYYEMIGKYDQFRAGWDDYWENPSYYDSTDESGNYLFVSPNRAKYEDMRREANDLLDKANKFIMVSLANHVISAIDAALAAKRYNRGKSEEMWLTVRAEMKKYSATEEIPILRFTHRF